MQLLAVNIGRSRQINTGKGEVETGIFKEPVDHPVHVHRLGLEGDLIADLKHHGGADQAVYLYSREDYEWWERKLGRILPAGQFGENLTLSSFGTDEVRIGDRFQINALLLEAAFVRIPCAKFGAKMGDPAFPKVFSNALRPGIYARVLQTGTVQQGDSVTFIPASNPGNPTAKELFQVYLGHNREAALINRCLNSPMSSRMKDRYKEWLPSHDT